MTEKNKLHIAFPASLDMILLLVNDSTGQSAKVTISLGLGGEPASTEAIRARIIKFRDEEMPRVAPGFRIATNQEFWDGMCIERFGEILAAAGLTFGPNIDENAEGGFFLRQEHERRQAMDEDDFEED